MQVELINIAGFEYDGVAKRIGFAPRLTPEQFKTPFTAAQGWGSYNQTIQANKLTAELTVAHGQVELASQTFELSNRLTGKTAKQILINGKSEKFTQDEERIIVTFANLQTLNVNDQLSIEIIC